MLCFQIKEITREKGNADYADIYDIKSRLVQYPLLQAMVHTQILISTKND